MGSGTFITAKYRLDLLIKVLLVTLFAGIQLNTYGQVGGTPVDTVRSDSARVKTIKVQNHMEDLSKQYDIGDLFQQTFHPRKKPDSVFSRSPITIIPNVAANPSIGAQIGIKAVAGKKLGGDPNTLLSVASTSASITTKGIIYFDINHNIYTPGNKWNLQGNIVVSKTVTPDYGFGIGKGTDQENPAATVLANPTHTV